jgi:hypothetical protein
VDAAEIVDLIDVPVTFPWRDGSCLGIIGTADIYAFSRAYAGAEFTADAFFHTVLITVEDMPAMEAGWFWSLFFGVLSGDPFFEKLQKCDFETVEIAHYTSSSSS